MQKWGLPSNTKRFFNLVVALGVTLLVIWVFVMSQTESGNPDYENYTPEQKARVDSIRQALGRDEVTARQDPTENMWDNMVWVLILLGGGLAVLWYWNQGNPDIDTSPFQVVSEFEVGPGHSLKIVEMGTEYWVLGVTANGISLLEKWTREEWEQHIPTQSTAGKMAGSNASFSQLFNRFKSSS